MKTMPARDGQREHQESQGFPLPSHSFPPRPFLYTPFPFLSAPHTPLPPPPVTKYCFVSFVERGLLERGGGESYRWIKESGRYLTT